MSRTLGDGARTGGSPYDKAGSFKEYISKSEYRRIRQRLGMSQAQLGDAVGVTKNTITRRETGHKRIPKEAGMAIKFLLIESLYNIPEDL